MTTLRAVLTVTVETKPDGDYYFDHADFLAHVVPWIEGGLDDRDDIRTVTITEQPAVVPSAPADRAALPSSFVLWLDASDGSVPTHDGIVWPDGTATVHHRHFGHTTTHSDPEAARRSAHGKQGRIVWPKTEPTDRAAIRAEAFQEAAEKLAGLDPAKGALAGESAWKTAAGVVRHMAVQERRMADGEQPADGPSRVADEAQQPTSTALLAANLPPVKGRCPACNGASLFLGDGGYVTCSRIDCPEPDAASTALEQPADGAQQPETQGEVAYRSPGTRTLYCLTCARQESGWQPVTAAEVRDATVCDFCGGRVLVVASRTVGDVVARYMPAPADRAALRETQGEVARLRGELAQAVEHRDYWHQEAMSATARIVELEPATPSQPAEARQADTAGEA